MAVCAWKAGAPQLRVVPEIPGRSTLLCREWVGRGELPLSPLRFDPIALNPQRIQERNGYVWPQFLDCALKLYFASFEEWEQAAANTKVKTRGSLARRGNALFIGWQFEKLIPCPRGALFQVFSPRGFLGGILMNALLGVLWKCGWHEVELWVVGREREGGEETLSLSLWSDHVCPFHPPRHQGFCCSLESLSDAPSIKYLTFIRCTCTIQR